MGESPIHAALEDLARRLDELHVPYAVVGAMALNAFGYRRATVDVDVLITPDGLARFKEAWLGRGYVERFAGSRGVRDAAHGVPIDFLLAGDYPGDGKPKPVRFPDPAAEAIHVEGLSILPLERLVELEAGLGDVGPAPPPRPGGRPRAIRARDLDEAFASRPPPPSHPRPVRAGQVPGTLARRSLGGAGGSALKRAAT